MGLSRVSQNMGCAQRELMGSAAKWEVSNITAIFIILRNLTFKHLAPNYVFYLFAENSKRKKKERKFPNIGGKIKSASGK